MASGKSLNARRAESTSPVPFRREPRRYSRRLRVVRIDGESSQFGTLGILPQTQCLISLSNIAGFGHRAERVLAPVENPPANAPIHRGGGKPTRTLVEPKRY